MTSSLRTVPAARTLERARAAARELGIVRVTDTTWLDRIGVPVFAAVRPESQSLCVNAGKGTHPDEARVGAYMEAIEFALAEYRHREVEVVVSTPRAVAAQPGAEFGFLDLCPLLGAPVDPDGPLACVPAEDVTTGRSVLVPAELVFHPFAENPGQRLFGTGTNGLCSGNSVDEATVHGLCEVIERDVRSFDLLRDRSRPVPPDGLGGDPRALWEKVEAAGLTAVLRCTPNEFGLPYFDGYVLEPDADAPVALAHGSGLHLLRDIAAVRALAEAAQSRLTYIHGGRDDLADRSARFAARGDGDAGGAERRAVRAARTRVLDPADPVPYGRVPDLAAAATGLDAALAALTGALARRGLRQVLRVVLSRRFAPLAVVRVIVPGLEHFQPDLRRVGPRLAALTGTGRGAR
ncbi:YcaO-like family protein [Kitasatospora phosalacinea]|nr:YcaO-like family protein [Kitasatospora phosalacinea]